MVDLSLPFFSGAVEEWDVEHGPGIKGRFTGLWVAFSLSSVVCLRQ